MIESQIMASRNVIDEAAIDFENDMQDVLHDLLNDKWRQLFDKFDPEGFGEIPWPDFLCALSSPEFQSEVDPKKRELLAEKAEQSKTNAITFQDFVNVMSGKRTRSFKIAVHHRDREVWSETDFHLIVPETSFIRKMVKFIAEEFVPAGRDRKYYTDNYTCCPPPLFLVIMTLIELGFFTFYTVNLGELTATGPVPIDSLFVYRPDKRTEIWRYLFYMVLHAGWIHLIFNLLVQIMIGLPLEMVHGTMRIGTVYMAGVLAGSLGTSVFDSDVYLVGASGGVYALLAAHLSNILLVSI
uniref:Peptidase S54 rhomboid domain-containing protein n=1 Tax=Strigamia maritima TaxID=126957 RepID=T1J9T3_STRMM